jgi:primosomal protein N' (replication factor Y)
MLPKALKAKKGDKTSIKYDTYYRLSDGFDDKGIFLDSQRKILDIVHEKGLVLRKELLDISSSSLKTLVNKGILVEEKKEHYRMVHDGVKEAPKILTSEQKKVVDTVIHQSARPYLLYGVTGSGKTEVYMHLIEKVIDMGKTAIMLVPEISLTTQIINNFYKRFGNQVAIFHSNLSEGERYDEYLKIYRGEVKIVVGTRSAIFTPLKDIGLIIIDEEHSDTYKQDSNPRYHAIDMAKFRAEYNKCPLILGSATPTLETMARAIKGVYKYISMPNRIGHAVLPKITIVDMAEELKHRSMTFSRILKSKIQDRLDKNEQVILLLNRRGYSTVISCKNCGYTFKCPNCDIALTYHKTSNNLRCHYCGYTILEPEKCPDCNEEALTSYGMGTEKLEQELEKLYPNARIKRMDADTTRNKGSHEDIINKFSNHEYDILLGTQMISKGLDFPLVTLVGVINADATLNMPDFRSGERTYQLLSQVSGRAGRSEIPGEVIIQTFNPDNYTLNCVKDNNYEKFYKYEMTNRHKLSYPPYYFITIIKIASSDYKVCSTEINKVCKYLKDNISSSSIILGPTPANMFRINNIYRFQIIVKYKVDDKLFEALKYLDGIYINNYKCNLEIDNNPLQV